MPVPPRGYAPLPRYPAILHLPSGVARPPSSTTHPSAVPPLYTLEIRRVARVALYRGHRMIAWMQSVACVCFLCYKTSAARCRLPFLGLVPSYYPKRSRLPASDRPHHRLHGRFIPRHREGAALRRRFILLSNSPPAGFRPRRVADAGIENCPAIPRRFGFSLRAYSGRRVRVAVFLHVVCEASGRDAQVVDSHHLHVARGLSSACRRP
ncbi:hypothetical protein C8R44DRAFT_340544 [Mycena epipterygia]|nr:hypothetical protein C8R44DRAFT_340544 [Mycena epipterygia]